MAIPIRRGRAVGITAVAALGLGALGAAPALAAPADAQITDAVVLVETLDEGAKVTALAVQYSEELDFGDVPLDPDAFTVTARLTGSTPGNTSSGERTVTHAYLSDAPERSPDRAGTSGEWVILELSRYDANAGVLYYTGINNQYPLDGAYSVRQTEDLVGDDETVPARSTTVVNTEVDRGVVDDFSVEQWTGEGSDFAYRFFEPEAVRDGEDDGRLYPLVLALHGSGESGTDNAAQLLANRLVTSWAEPEAQAEHPAFVMAPQRHPDLSWQNEEGRAGLFAMVEHAKETLPIDPDRVYITGLSLGSIGTWNLLIDDSDVFAGAVTVAYGPGANPGLEELVDFPIWQFHSEDDRTVPVQGVYDSVTALEELGVDVVQRRWAGNLPLAEATALQTEQRRAAQDIGAHHLVTIFEEGTTGTPPDADGPSIPLSGHFSWVPAYNNPVTHDWLMSQVRGATQPVTGQTTDGFDVEVSIPDTGGLAVAVGTDRVSLGTAGLETGLSHLAASGDLPTITVADTRPADPGWSLTAEVSDFRAGAAVLEGRYLGVTPRVLSAAPTQEVTAGEPVAPGEGFTDGTTLASAAPGGGRGTTTVGGELLLHAPTSTVPGDYVARVTVTVF